ncbi:MAG: N-6 DNA methylase [Sulfurospirillaceae bacterium]|nr:N-6 DNA methylase [Sulfurospirillaceae bacterium]
MYSKAEAENNDHIIKAISRGIVEIKGDRVTYHIRQKKSYTWSDPEEWVRAFCISFLVLEKGYPTNRIKTEVKVPRRTPSDLADIVIYQDDACKSPYLVIECKAAGQSDADRTQGIEQLFGNSNSLRTEIGIYEEYEESLFFDVKNYPAEERQENNKGTRDAIPEQYGNIPEYTYIAGPGNNDIAPVTAKQLEIKIKRAHSIIWAGGKRDPLTAFDQWSKLLFAKVEDERTTPNNTPRKFQVGTNETSAAVATRVHELFEQASRNDRTIFPEGVKIELSDGKIKDIVKVLQNVSITDASADSIGAAFERFFGSVFRGELGQYFTMRQLARFTVAMLDIKHTDYVIDPTAGSGGFLLEVLLQVWHSLDKDYAGRSELDRYKNDFALHKVFGIEIHEILARICKINLLLHHDGHTNIEGDRSCLDTRFNLARLSPYQERFTRVVGNPPFGDEVVDGDDDLLGGNTLHNFDIAEGRSSVPSEHAIMERAVDLLEPNGKFGLILPDGVFNNHGELSNCPATRRYLAKNGKIEAIVSLPDYAFRKSGAQNKTSVLFFKKYSREEKVRFDRIYNDAIDNEQSESSAILTALNSLRYKVFLAEANFVGYTTTGIISDLNDLYREVDDGRLSEDQEQTIYGEYSKFVNNPNSYSGSDIPDCMAIDIIDMWQSHESHRMDPKYFLFKKEEQSHVPEGWIKLPISKVMKKRENIIKPEINPEQEVVVMTLSQTGEIRPREAGKGNNPPEWLGMYFGDSSSTWFSAKAGDVVFSSIDLWKGCISVVPDEFDGAIVTKEFPIYEVIDERIDPDFLSSLLRSRYYKRAFRAITTGHSNRRRTQASDFEKLEICFPENKGYQREIVSEIISARTSLKSSNKSLAEALKNFDHLIDGRDVEIPNSFDNNLNEGLED